MKRIAKKKKKKKKRKKERGREERRGRKEKEILTESSLALFYKQRQSRVATFYVTNF